MFHNIILIMKSLSFIDELFAVRTTGGRLCCHSAGHLIYLTVQPICNAMTIFIPVLCHSDSLVHRKFLWRLDVVRPGHVWFPRLHAPVIVPCIISFSVIYLGVSYVIVVFSFRVGISRSSLCVYLTDVALQNSKTLLDSLCRCSSPDTFKRSLKSHLYIQSYFNCHRIGSCLIVTFV